MYNAVVHGMGRLLAAFFDFIPNYGVGIILLTVLVRLAMIPLAVKQFHIMEANRANAEKMRKLLPEVKKIRDKFRDDRAKQYEEQKKLYDQHGVNMLGGLSGCLPLLVQMPIFMAMYSVLSGCNKIFGSGRRCTLGFHMPDGSALKAAIVEGRDTFLGMNLNLRPSGVLQDQGLLEALPYYLLVGVMGYTMWFQTRQMMKAQPVVDPQMAQTQKVMQFMPLVIVFASLSFPAGLTVYWSATNIWSIGQQSLFIRKLGPARALKEEKAVAAGEPEAKPREGKLGSKLKAALDQASRPREAATSAQTGTPEGAAEGEPAGAAGGKSTRARSVGSPAGRKTGGQEATAGAPKSTRTKTTGDAAAGRSGARGSAASAQKKSPAKTAAQKGTSAGGAGTKKPAARTSASGSGAAKKPAASRARATGSAGGTPGGKPATKTTKSSGSKAGTGGSGAGSGAGRPKGSGARKKSKGGHR